MNRLESYLIKALSHSMTVHRMEKLSRMVIPGYDLHKRSGFPETIPIPQMDAAQQVVSDISSEGLLIRFVEILIEIDRDGLMGRSMSIRSLSQVIDELESLGFIFHEGYGVFIERGGRVKTKGWGILREEINYEFSFLSLDIVGSSALVRNYPENKIAKAYKDLNRIITKIVERREGRIWSWEGDGGLAAFYFGNKNVQATLTGLEILLELFMHNLLVCPFKEPLHMRLAVHTGPCQFLNNVEEIRSETLRRIRLIESKYTEADGLTISPGVYTDLGTKLERFFKPYEISERNFLYTYKMDWE